MVKWLDTSAQAASPLPGCFCLEFESLSMLINFPYIDRDSPIHRLDPRTKLVLMFAYSFSAAQTSNFWIILVGLIGAAFYYSQAHLKWRETNGLLHVLHTQGIPYFLLR